VGELLKKAEVASQRHLDLCTASVPHNLARLRPADSRGRLSPHTPNDFLAGSLFGGDCWGLLLGVGAGGGLVAGVVQVEAQRV
jgi:hypothetical protein